MEELDGKTFEGERIVLGERRYRNCRFVRCLMVFTGAPPEAHYCHFEYCTLKLEGAAVETLKYLKSLSDGGAAKALEAIGFDLVGASFHFGEGQSGAGASRGPSVLIQDCEAVNNRGDGFRIGPGTGATLIGNSASGNGGSGFVFGGGTDKDL